MGKFTASIRILYLRCFVLCNPYVVDLVELEKGILWGSVDDAVSKNLRLVMITLRSYGGHDVTLGSMSVTPQVRDIIRDRIGDSVTQFVY
jgi:hypothetical protein